MKKRSQKKTSDRENKTKTNPTGVIPYGREAVKKAILDATEKLLLKKTPNQITVREIAETAGIKHPLIHRHFGTKEGVIIAVHARAMTKAERKVARLENLEGNIGAFFEAVKRNKFRQIALTRAMLDSVHPRALPTEFPLMRRLLELVRKRCQEKTAEPKFTPELITAVLAAAVLGWLQFEPFLLFSTGMDDKKQSEIHKMVVEVLEEILREIC